MVSVVLSLVFISLFHPSLPMAAAAEMALDDLMTPDEIAEEAGLPRDDEDSIEDEWAASRRQLPPWPEASPFDLPRALGWKPRMLMPATPIETGMSARQWVEELNERDKDLAEVVLIVNKAARGTTAQRMRLYVDGVERMTYTVSTGREKYETAKSGRSYWTITPTGYFRPTEVKPKHYSNTWKTWLQWVVFFRGGVAIHATTPDHHAELGTRASGACVRMREPEAKEIFDLVMERGRGSVPVINRDGGTELDASGRPLLHENWNTLVIVRNIED
jgi:hypothetical protein